MDGYWGQPEATRAVHPRRLAAHRATSATLDADGYLRITDRKRDHDRAVRRRERSPAKIEGMLMAEPEIAQAVIAGEGRSGLTALLVPTDGHDCDSRRRGQPGQQAAPGYGADSRQRRGAALHVENGLMTPTQKNPPPLVLRAHATTLARLHA